MDYTTYLVNRAGFKKPKFKPIPTVVMSPAHDEEGNVIVVEKIIDFKDQYGDCSDYSLRNLLKAGINIQATGSVNTAITVNRSNKEMQAKAFLESIPAVNENIVTNGVE